MAATKRGNPIGRAGNYAAPVDAAGMDSTMKATLMPPKQPKKKGIVGRIKDAMGIKY
jgi:hypothetical protein